MSPPPTLNYSSLLDPGGEGRRFSPGRAGELKGGGGGGGSGGGGGGGPEGVAGATSSSMAVDLDSLMAESERLNAHISSPEGIPALKKSLPEMELSARSIANQATASAAGDALELSSQAAAQRAEQRGMRLLAQCNFDVELSSRQVATLQLQPSREPLQATGQTDIAGFLESHHHKIVASAVEDAKRAAEEAALFRQRQWEWDDWKRVKSEHMKNMGHRMGQWEARDLDTRRERALAAEDTEAQSFKLRVGGALSSTVVMNGENNLNVKSRQSRLTAETRRYADIIRALNEHELGCGGGRGETAPVPQGGNSSTMPVMSEMATAVEEFVPDGAVVGTAVMHARVWRLLEKTVEGPAYSGAASHPNLQPRQRRLRATLEHLQSQFREMMRRKVAAAAARGQLSSPPGLSATPGLRADVKAHVEILRKSLHTAGPLFDGEPLWPQIYFCLRCGGLQQAAEIASSAGMCDEVLPRVADRLSTLDVGASMTPNDFEEIRRAYERGNAMDSPDIYRQVVLNLLLCSDPGNTQQVIKTMEDYVWFKLWFCLTSAPAAIDRRQMTTPYGLADLQHEVSQKFGAEHFDRDGRNPFLYASVLFLCQLFSEGVDYLHRSGLDVAAVHLGIALAHWEVLPLSKEEGDSSSGGGGVADLVAGYSLQLQTSDPQIAVEYIMRLHSTNVFDSAVQRLLLDSRQYCVLVGEIGADGRRTVRGILDRYLSSGEIQRILDGAASLAQLQGMARDAVALYGLAGQYIEVLRVLNRQLSITLVPPHPNREELKAVAHEFFEKHLAHGQTYVQEQLSSRMQEGSQVGTTFHALLNLGVFFDHWEAGRWRDALGIAEGLKLLPNSESEVILCAEGFRQLPDEIRNNFHAILLTAMECMHHLHVDVKRRWDAAASAARGSQEATEHQLMELRQRANALVTFASVLKDSLPNDTSSRLARMEVIMM